MRNRRKWLRACQVRPQGDCAVEVAPRSLARVVRAEVDGGRERPLAFEPVATDRVPVRSTLMVNPALKVRASVLPTAFPTPVVPLVS